MNPRTPRRWRRRLLALLTQAALAAPAAQAVPESGDPLRGEAVFARECGDCHTVVPGIAKKGPSLAAIINRAAGRVEGFRYSEAMQASALVWTAETLDQYIRAPRERVPGTRMKYPGLDNPAERDDLIAWLAAPR